MQYNVNSPEEEGLRYHRNYQLKLIHKEKNIELDFNNLSSGEKILMALVSCVYKASFDKHFPQVLLLDEVDASLHPSMMQNMLNVIEKVFLENGVKVILVTHSPTTIALAPEESVYVMNRSGKNRIEKKSKQDALSILTQGFATLEQGLKLFDELSNSDITIITEGNNANIINKYLQLSNISGVNVLGGIESISGKNQLKTLFEFFSKINHDNKVIFVWDCDVNFSLEVGNNTFPFIFPKNNSNLIAKSGIENLFPEELFQDFLSLTKKSRGEEIKSFDNSRKKCFEKMILERNNIEDFKNFHPLKSEIEKIKNSGSVELKKVS